MVFHHQHLKAHSDDEMEEERFMKIEKSQNRPEIGMLYGGLR